MWGSRWEHRAWVGPLSTEAAVVAVAAAAQVDFL